MNGAKIIESDETGRKGVGLDTILVLMYLNSNFIARLKLGFHLGGDKSYRHLYVHL